MGKATSAVTMWAPEASQAACSIFLTEPYLTPAQRNTAHAPHIYVNMCGCLMTPPYATWELICRGGATKRGQWLLVMALRSQHSGPCNRSHGICCWLRPLTNQSCRPGSPYVQAEDCVCGRQRLRHAADDCVEAGRGIGQQHQVLQGGHQSRAGGRERLVQRQAGCCCRRWRLPLWVTAHFAAEARDASMSVVVLNTTAAYMPGCAGVCAATRPQQHRMQTVVLPAPWRMCNRCMCPPEPHWQSPVACS